MPDNRYGMVPNILRECVQEVILNEETGELEEVVRVVQVQNREPFKWRKAISKKKEMIELAKPVKKGGGGFGVWWRATATTSAKFEAKTTATARVGAQARVPKMTRNCTNLMRIRTTNLSNN